MSTQPPQFTFHPLDRDFRDSPFSTIRKRIVVTCEKLAVSKLDSIMRSSIAAGSLNIANAKDRTFAGYSSWTIYTYIEMGGTRFTSLLDAVDESLVVGNCSNLVSRCSVVVGVIESVVFMGVRNGVFFVSCGMDSYRVSSGSFRFSLCLRFKEDVLYVAFE